MPSHPAAVARKDEEYVSSYKLLKGGGLQPRPVDILLSRTQAAFVHPGNVHFRSMIASQVEQYKNGSRKEKTLLVLTVMKDIKKNNGRFLCYEKGEWVDAGFQAGRDKVAHLFRDAKHGRSLCVRELVQKLQREKEDWAPQEKQKRNGKKEIRILANPEHTKSNGAIAWGTPLVLQNATSPTASVVQREKKATVSGLGIGQKSSHKCMVLKGRASTQPSNSEAGAGGEGWAAARFYASESDDDEDNCCYDCKVSAKKFEEPMLPENQTPPPAVAPNGSGGYHVNLNISLDSQSPRSELMNPSILQSILPQATLESVVYSALQSAIQSAIQPSFDSTTLQQLALQLALRGSEQQPLFQSQQMPLHHGLPPSRNFDAQLLQFLAARQQQGSAPHFPPPF